MHTVAELLHGKCLGPCRGAAVAAVLAATLSAGARADRAPIVGAWKSHIYAADCESGDTSGDGIYSLHTYFADGKLAEIGMGSSPVLPTTLGLGTWKKAGKGVFASTVQVGIMDADGNYQGYMVRDRMTTLARDKQSLELQVRVNLYNTDGQLLSSNCGQGTGVRLPLPTPLS